MAQQELEEQPWRHLPLDLLIRVLGCLPLPCLLRFRHVCKLWHSSISSPSFSRIVSPPLYHPTATPPLLVLYQPPHTFAIAFDFHLQSWLPKPLPSLLHHPLAFPSCSSLCSSGNSLLLQLSPLQPLLHLSNPLTSTILQLPPFQSIQSLLPGMFAAGRSSIDQSYIALAAGESASSANVVELYSSNTNSWEVHFPLPADSVIQSQQRMLECNGSFYALLATPRAMLTIRLEGSRWTYHIDEVHDLGSRLLWSRLIVWKKSIFLVQRVESVFIRSNNVLILRLVPEKSPGCWALVGCMPPDVNQEPLVFECVGAGDIMCLRANDRTLTYDGNSWNWLPDCPYEVGMQTHAFHWEPNLYWKNGSSAQVVPSPRPFTSRDQLEAEHGLRQLLL